MAAKEDGEAATPPPGHHKPAKKLKGQLGEKGIQKGFNIDPKPEGVKRWRKKKGSNDGKCANVGSKQYLKQWAKSGIKLD